MSNHSTNPASLNAKVEAMLRRQEAAHEMLQESADRLLFLIAVLRRGDADNIVLDAHGANGLAAILEDIHNQINNAIYDAAPWSFEWRRALKNLEAANEKK